MVDKNQSLPKYGNILIIAGNAGRELNNLLKEEFAFDGKHIEIGFIKEQMEKFQMNSFFDREFFELYGKHISQTGMGNEQDVYNLQSFCKKKGFDKKTMHQFIQHSSRQTTKDNMIFDVPSQNIRKIIEIVLYCEMVGYERERIHILWVLNDSQDASISSSIHNVIENAKDLLDDTDGSPLMEGNMWILLSTANHNNLVTTNHNDGIYANKDIIIKVKKNEKTIKTYEEIMDEYAMSSIKDID